jgi:hypothetical protein
LRLVEAVERRLLADTIGATDAALLSSGAATDVRFAKKRAAGEPRQSQRTEYGQAERDTSESRGYQEGGERREALRATGRIGHRPGLALTDIRAAFEDAWRRGQPPQIESVLKEWALADQPMVLHELVSLDVEYRKARGESCTIEEYTSRFPELDRAWLEGVLAGPGLPGASPSIRPFSVPLPALPPRYTILNCVGTGGGATVFKAIDNVLARLVAITVPREGLAIGSHVDRLVRGVRALARVDHPHVVPIFDCGEFNGLLFVTMGFMEGGTLDMHLERGEMTPTRAARIILALATAISSLHDKGVIHRNIHPGKILFDRFDNVHLAPPSFATLLGPKTTGMLAGTAGYISPEQTGMDPLHSGPATDVWALGAVLYKCLTGRVPFEGSSLDETYALIRQATPVPPSQLRPSVPHELELICLKCLQAQPTDRYSAEKLAKDLRSFLEEKPASVLPVEEGKPASVLPVEEGKPASVLPVEECPRGWGWFRGNRGVAFAMWVAFCVGMAVGWIVGLIMGGMLSGR